MKSKIKILAIILSSIFLLSSCAIGKEINDRSFVQIIGLEKNFGKYNLSLQIYESESSNGNPDVSKSNSKVITGTGDTFFKALAEAEKGVGKDLFLPHAKLIVLGKGLENISGDIKIFLGENISPTCPIVFCNNPKDIISTEITSGIFTADAISRILQNQIYNDKIIYSSLSNVAENISVFNSEVALPIIKSFQNEISFSGFKIISDKKFKDSFPDKKILGTKILSDDFSDSNKILFSLNIKSSDVTVEIFPNSKRTAKLVDGILNFNLDCNISAKIIENHDEISNSKIEKYLTEKLSEEIFGCYNSVAKNNGYDIFEIEKLVRKYDNKNYNLYKSNKTELIKNSVLNINFDCEINNKQAHFHL